MSPRKGPEGVATGVIFKSHSGVYTGTVRRWDGVQEVWVYDTSDAGLRGVVESSTVSLIGYPITRDITRIDIDDPGFKSGLYGGLAIWQSGEMTIDAVEAKYPKRPIGTPRNKVELTIDCKRVLRDLVYNRDLLTFTGPVYLF